MGRGGLLIIVVGLAFEARIAAGPGRHVISGGNGRNLTAMLTAAIAEARMHFGDECRMLRTIQGQSLERAFS